VNGKLGEYNARSPHPGAISSTRCRLSFRDVGQAARARLQEAMLMIRVRRDRRSFAPPQPDVQQRACVRLDGRAPRRKVIGYQNVVMTIWAARVDVGLVVKDSVRSYDFRPIIDRGWSEYDDQALSMARAALDRIRQQAASEPRASRPEKRGSMPARRASASANRADRHGCRCRARLHQSGLLSRRRMRLDKEIARFMRSAKKCEPLGVSVERAPKLFAKSIHGNMDSAIMKEVHPAATAEDFILFVGGGAGATMPRALRAT